jgi:hypothetical protein
MSTPAVERAQVEGNGHKPDARDEPGGRVLATTPTFRRTSPFRAWYWALVPFLAIAAYVTVLRIGFLADDLLLLIEGRSGNRLAHLLPSPDWFLYRPVGQLFIWDLGWTLWGYNPLPFHLQGLLLHAGVALVLGLWVSEVSSRRWMGLLVGALFAVYPLNSEAVGWLAAQWDALAALFGLLSLWLFTRWWLRREGAGRPLYFLSLLFLALGVYTKESLLTFLPLFVLSAWAASPMRERREWLRLGYVLLPFAAVTASNLALRFAAWGGVGGYQSAPTNYQDFIWTGLVNHGSILLAPVSSVLLGNATAQIARTLIFVLLLLGLVWYGREQRRLLTVAVAWINLALIPALNLPVNGMDLGNNRLLYLASAGYCLLLGALLYSLLANTGRWRLLALAATGLVVLLSAGVCWVHLRPWHTTTVQARDLEAELRRVIPLEPRPRGMVWYAQDIPGGYQGAQLLGTALGLDRQFRGGDWPRSEKVDRAAEVDLSGEHRDAFALRFLYSQSANRFHTSYASGITWQVEPPSPQEEGEQFRLWDFQECAPETLAEWQVVQARAVCEQNEGLILRDTGDDQQMISPALSLDPSAAGARFVRLRVAVRYPSNVEGPKLVSEWFWKGHGEGWSGERLRSMTINQDGSPHVYWTFLPASEVEGAITGLRFDPANGAVAAAVKWVAVDMVR